MLKLGFVLIGIIILLITIYILRVWVKMNTGTVYKQKNEDNIVKQIECWEKNYELSSDSIGKKEDLFSPSKMKNGNLDTNELQIIVKDYTSQVPWFFRI